MLLLPAPQGNPEFTMTLLQLIAAAAFAAACHVLALRVAVRLMVELRVEWPLAARIIGAEYVAVSLIVAGLLALAPGEQALTLVVASLAYLFIGAYCLGRWVRFTDGSAVGVGNGVLIQAIQIPLIIPVFILASFLVAPPGAGAPG